MRWTQIGRRAMPAVLAAGMLATMAGCAQQVGDIDRTQPNKLKKADFDGQWYFRQTVANVPPDNAFFFTGLSTGLEKIAFEITERSLIGYRTYELVPGADPGADTQGVNDTEVVEGFEEGYNGDTYKGSPVVAYSIAGHFDVQRAYNSSTGEQSNVIVENYSDRYWNDREFMRVSWSSNQISNINLFDTSNAIQNVRYYGDEDPLAQTFVQEFDDDGKMVYFEFTTKSIIVPSYACYYYYNADCGPTEVEIVSSFARVPEKQTYEAVEYDNIDMFKFGYFRTERVTYDRKRGLRRSGQIFLPNRHNIWETAFAESGDWDGREHRNAQGELVDNAGARINAHGQLLDAEGQLIALPLTERKPRPVIYYMNAEMPEALEPYNKDMADDWNRAFTRASAAAMRVEPGDFQRDMFVLCHNPVSANDDPVCGEVGKVVRVGDVRYNHVYWVHQPQIGGPLGYGPSAADPETGEIISGTAYVYGGSVDTYAASSLDIIKLIITCEENGEESVECQRGIDQITSGSDVRADILNRLRPGIDPRANAAPELAEIPVPGDWRELLDVQTASRLQANTEDPLPWDAGFEQRQLHVMKEKGFDLALLDQQSIRDLTAGRHTDVTEMDEETLEQIRPANWMTATKIQNLSESRIQHFAKNNIMMSEFFDDVVAGLAIGLAREAATIPEAQRDEYMYQKVRGLIYRGVMAHEVGHTLGLRHNFQGSYDSLNFFDDYWRLRKENLREVQFVNDLYEVSAQTENQRLGRVVDTNGNVVDELGSGMYEFGYSSIMDYGLRFNTDFKGIGKYDEAAIIYAYTTGHDGRTSETGDRLVDSGYVEVWTDAAFADAQKDEQGNVVAADVIRQLDFRTSLAYTHLLEGFHYTTVAGWWGNVENIKKRELTKYDDIVAARDADDPNRPVEVPYMFCTDDWVGVDSSCHRWDHGADPFEQTMFVVNAYRDYYWFTNFARDSLSWSPFSKVSRTYSRYFSYLTNIYQQLFFGGDYDGIQSTYRWLAANAGLNLVAEVMSTPNYGEHVLNKDGILVHCFDADSIEFEEDGVTTTTSEKCSNDRIDRDIPMGQGRYPFNRFNFNDGYTYYYYPTEAGHFYDYLAAVLALTTSRAVVRGVDVNTDGLAYSLPYYIVFDQPLNRLVNSIWLEQPGPEIGPVLMDDQVYYRPISPVSFGNTRVDPLSGRAVNSKNIPTGMENGTIIQPYHSWNMRLYPMLYGMAFFSSNYELQFVDNNHIFRLGNGEQVNAGGPGFELVTCEDPLYGHTYGALRNTGSAVKSGAVTMVERCSQQAQAFVNARSGLRFEEAADHQRDLENTLLLINLTRGYYNAFGQVF